MSLWSKKRFKSNGFFDKHCWRLSLSLRPECIEISPASAHNQIRAHIEEVIYLGDNIRIRINISGRNNFIVKVTNKQNQDALTIGSEVTIGWQTQGCRAFELIT